jgi:putative long chain acyl-CoA synthase
MLQWIEERRREVRNVAQNTLEIVRYGGLETGEEPAPHALAQRGAHHRLRHYFPEDKAPARPPILLIPPTLLVADMYDVSPQTSAVGDLHAAGLDPWVVDFGSPAVEAGGMERTLSDHTLAVDSAITHVAHATGRSVFVCAYSQGGTFAYQAVALRRSADVSGIATLGSPVDWHRVISIGLPQNLAAGGAAWLFDAIGSRTAIPAWVVREGFRIVDPVKSARAQLKFIRQLHDREALLRREGQRRFIEVDGWVPWSGPAIVEFAHEILADNRMMSGGLVIEDRPISLADITSPVLIVVGESDGFARAEAIRGIVQASPRADVWERVVRTGHFGLVVGSAAKRDSWPTIVAWTRWVEGVGAQPENLHRPAPPDGPAPTAVEGIGADVVLGARAGVTGLRWAASLGKRAVVTAEALVREGIRQVPRLSQLEQLRPHTLASLGRMLDDAAEHDPDGVYFLFEDRAYTHGDAKRRADAVVRGLLSLGVRRGDPVGVLMSARPSALATVAALNRIGAVAVLLRPDGDPLTEHARFAVNRVISEPELVDAARALDVPIAVLGGAGTGRSVPADVCDLEAVDPEAVTVPVWFEANPGRARDLAFVLFTGEREAPRASRITNGRWVTSALGTASSAALRPQDTIYCVTPPSHPSGLLVALGGSIAGRARLAFGRQLEPVRVVGEARRYGATVVVYTWSMLRVLLDAGAAVPNVRLFIGSGMPRALWLETLRTMAPARVVEFWTTAESDAVLVNLGTGAPGSAGRPLPGGARLSVVEVDLGTGEPILDESGLACRCRPGTTGLLLAETEPEVADRGLVIARRGVFTAGDAWIDTGELFCVDSDGEYWRIDRVTALVHRPVGPGSPVQARDALERSEAIVTAATYPLSGADGQPLLAAAVVPRAGVELTAAALDAALADAAPLARPDYVRVVERIDYSTLYRPLTSELIEERTVASRPGRPAWRVGPDGAVQIEESAASAPKGELV